MQIPYPQPNNGIVAELVYALVLETSASGIEGSTPSDATNTVPSSNGRTTGSEPVDRGSNPWGTTTVSWQRGLLQGFAKAPSRASGSVGSNPTLTANFCVPVERPGRRYRPSGRPIYEARWPSGKAADCNPDLHVGSNPTRVSKEGRMWRAYGA